MKTTYLKISSFIFTFSLFFLDIYLHKKYNTNYLIGGGGFKMKSSIINSRFFRIVEAGHVPPRN